MKKTIFAIAGVASFAAGIGMAAAASAINLDQESRTIIVTEGGTQHSLEIPAGQSVQFCLEGCFVVLPNGDREALAGGEIIEIQGGRARVR